MLRDVLSQIPDKPSPVSLPTSWWDYMDLHQIPKHITDDLAASSYADWIAIGPVDLIPMANLIDETDSITRCIENGFLPVAGCRNFDPVVVDRRSLRIYYVCLDALWDDELTNFQDCLVATPYLYDDFWQAAHSIEKFPRDSYQAGKSWKDLA